MRDKVKKVLLSCGQIFVPTKNDTDKEMY